MFNLDNQVLAAKSEWTNLNVIFIYPPAGEASREVENLRISFIIIITSDVN